MHWSGNKHFVWKSQIKVWGEAREVAGIEGIKAEMLQAGGDVALEWLVYFWVPTSIYIPVGY